MPVYSKNKMSEHGVIRMRAFCMIQNVKWKVQRVPHWQTAANLRHQEEKKKIKRNTCKINKHTHARTHARTRARARARATSTLFSKRGGHNAEQDWTNDDKVQSKRLLVNTTRIRITSEDLRFRTIDSINHFYCRRQIDTLGHDVIFNIKRSARIRFP